MMFKDLKKGNNMKKIIALSAVAFLSTSVFASADADARIAKLEKKLAKLSAKVSKVNSLAAKDNIKFDVDFRTSMDQISYKMVSGAEHKNDALLANRLWLNMGYAPTENMVFKGQLAYNKAMGARYAQRGTGLGFDTFDWISSEALNDDKLRVREAYWLYTDNIGDVGVTASVGRRPATNGYLANLREDDKKPKSPLGHVINMEFDGASASIKLDKLSPGFMFKICLGRGLTNAAGWASGATSAVMPWDAQIGSMAGGSSLPNYATDPSSLDTVDMAGFIFVPYDDGQYALKTTWYRGINVPGLVNNPYYDDTNATMGPQMMMQSHGNMDGMAVSLKVDGLGDGISDFLDETTVFASYAMSTTQPEDGQAMLGSLDSETGTSIWAGVVMPNGTGGRFGLEYNKGSEYWRPFTYGEDTMTGSKLATRGTAIEAYWGQPLIDEVFSMQVRYTQINYDYTGSDGFFGAGGTPLEMDTAKMYVAGGFMPDVIESSSDLRINFRYRY